MHSKDLDQFSTARILSIAVVVIDDANNTILNYYTYVKPTDDYNFDANSESIKIHGLTPEFLEKNGKPINDVLYNFIYFMFKYDINTLIAHNARFDYKVLCSEFHRAITKEAEKDAIDRNEKLQKDFINALNIIQDKDQIKLYCTMMEGLTWLKEWHKKRGLKMASRKFPKLSELYQVMFQREIPQENLHNALQDTLNCLEIYKQLQIRL